MASESYYYDLIDECNAAIRKKQEEIQGLEAFRTENSNGAEEFSAVVQKKRNHINNSLSSLLKHPMVRKLNSRLAEAVGSNYEKNVLDNFDAIEDDINAAIRRLKNEIEEEKSNIETYRQRIYEIQEERRREEERRQREEEERRRKEDD